MLDRRSCGPLILLCALLNLLFICSGFATTLFLLLHCGRYNIPSTTSSQPSQTAPIDYCDDKQFNTQRHLILSAGIFFALLMLWCIHAAFALDVEEDRMDLTPYAEQSVGNGVTFAITCGWILVGLLNTGGWLSPLMLLVGMLPSVFVWSLECCTE
jgi:hypothetical protein